MSTAERRPMVISPLWFRGVVLTFLFGFTILGYLAIRVYQDQAPIPGRVVSEKGQVILTREDILDGQEASLTYGLMQYGSIYGHGAYLGPDFTADYLHRQALKIQEIQGGDGKAEERVRLQLQTNRYDPNTDTLTWSDEQVQAFDWLCERYREEFLNRERSGAGLGPRAIPDLSEAR
jgi:nitric oxide reductase subunit B